MGYTAYIRFNVKRGQARKLERAYQKAIRTIDAYVKRCKRAGHRLSGYTAHVHGYSGIKFNGIKDDSCEDFVLRAHLKENDSLIFCKTNFKPYTPVVYGALWRLKKYLGDAVEISCDGNLSLEAMKRQSRSKPWG